MLECGARFNEEYYIKVSIDPEDRTNNHVIIEQIVDGEKIVRNGTITFNNVG